MEDKEEVQASVLDVITDSFIPASGWDDKMLIEKSESELLDLVGEEVSITFFRAFMKENNFKSDLVNSELYYLLQHKQ